MPQQVTQILNGAVKFTVPLVPPSVNHYWKFWVHRGVLCSGVTPEGKAFLQAVAIFARGQTLIDETKTDYAIKKTRYAVTYRVYLGEGDRGDLANFEKAIGDGLQKARVIHSDDAIDEYHQYKFRDRGNPRTEIEATRK